MFVASCATDDGAKPRLTQVTTEPPGALVTIVGFGECESPCVIEHDAPREIVVAKAGFKPRTLTITGKTKSVELKLELAAPTEQVDERVLPDL